MNAPDEAAIWAAIKAAGMLTVATDNDGDFDVDFRKPDRALDFGGAISRQYEIEYQYADRPNLAEGNQLQIDGNWYTVRQPPTISDDGNASTGFFRRAILTKQAAGE